MTAPIPVHPACPTCRPELDPGTYVVSWCRPHAPDLSGSADRQAREALDRRKWSGR